MNITNEFLEKTVKTPRLTELKKINDELRRKLIYIQVNHLTEEGKHITTAKIHKAFDKWTVGYFTTVKDHWFNKKSITLEVIQMNQEDLLTAMRGEM